MIHEHVKDGVVRITLDSRRWYYFEDTSEYKPSITWILEAFPKDQYFYQYLASLPSWEYGQQTLSDAGDQGSRVHLAIERLLAGEPVSYFDVPFGYSEHYTKREWEMILAFQVWFQEWKPQVIAVEETVEGDGYAGTVDLICTINGEQWIVDWKTSKSGIYESYKLQVAAYAKALNIQNAMIVRLGSRHKVGFEVWTNHDKNARTLDEYYEVFEATKKVWQFQNPNPHPRFYEAKETITLMENTDDGVTQEHD